MKHSHNCPGRCRPARPRCRMMRRRYGKLCECGAYHFPHRLGSGACGDPVKQWERNTGLSWAGGESNV